MSDYSTSTAEVEPDDADDIELEFEAETEEGQKNSIGWTAEELEEKAKELLECIAELRMDQKGKLEKVLKWRRQVEAVAEPRLRSINPLKNPSNVVPPLTQTYHQSLSAWITNYFATQPFFGVRALKDTDDARLDATFLTKYLNILGDSASDLNIGAVKRMIADETALIGRCMVKVVWTRDSWAYKRFTEDNPVPVTEEMVYHEGPEVVVIRPEEIVFSPQWNDLYDLPMIAHLYRLPRHELEALGARGVFEPGEVEKVLGHGQTILSMSQTTLLNDEGIKPSYVDDYYDIAEVWFYCDHDEDGIAEEYVFSIHIDSGCVLRSDFNELGSRMFENFRWIAHTYDLDGRGVGQALEGLQDEASSVHNIRNDSMKIVNMRMLQMPSSVLKANSEELYPGKIWVNDNLQSAPIQPLQLGEVYPSSLEAEDRTWQLAAQATAFSEVQRGFSDQVLKSRDTWRGQQLRMGQSQGITTTIADGMRETWDRVTLLILLQLIAHRETVLERERKIGRLTDEEIGILDRLLAMDPKDVPINFAFVARTIDGDRTQAAQMQGLQLVSGSYQAWVQQATPLAQFLFTPQGQMMQQQVPELYNFMLKNLVGSTKLVEKMMTLAGIDDAGSYLPRLDKWEFFIQLMEGMQQEQLAQLEAQTGQRRLGIGEGNGTNGSGRQVGVPGIGSMGAIGEGGGGSAVANPSPTAAGGTGTTGPSGTEAVPQ